MTEPARLDEWTCGHVAGSVCAECHRQLIVKANALAAENMELREPRTDVVELVRKAREAARDLRDGYRTGVLGEAGDLIERLADALERSG